MRPYSELNALAPTEFLNWEQFGTAFDAMESNVARQDDKYQKGLEVGQRSTYVFISGNGTWGARGRDGSQTTSYEGIGYHAGTAHFWRGVLDSGVPICIYRSVPYNSGKPSSQWIVGSQDAANERAECSLARD